MDRFRNIIAESLIAFSRTPLISSMYTDLPSSVGNTNICRPGSASRTEVGGFHISSTKSNHFAISYYFVKQYDLL